MITENLSTLKIHKLSQAQYDRELENGTIDENALYLTPDEGVDLSGYALETEVADTYETKTDASSKLDEAKLYTDQQVENALNGQIELGHTHDDLYYTETEIDEKVSELSTSISNMANIVDNTYETKTDASLKFDESKQYTDSSVSTARNELLEIIDEKSEIGHIHGLEEVNGLQAALNAKSDNGHIHDDRYYTEAEVDTKVSTIQNVISDLSAKFNALADSDDTTLDQLSEVVAYIKSNKSLIDAITTSKVNVADIVDNLVTSASDKPLSAAQGVVLKTLIDGHSDLKNNPHNVTIDQIGAAPAGYVTKTIRPLTLEELHSSLDTVLDSMSNGSVQFIRVIATGRGFDSFTGAHILRVYRHTADYAQVTAFTYGATKNGSSIVEYNSKLNGVWQKWSTNVSTENIAKYAAPAGYGLGGVAMGTDDFNTCVNNGWYCGLGALNAPSFATYASYGLLLVLRQSGTLVVQKYYAYLPNNGIPNLTVAMRTSADSGASWTEWEYDNPPMKLGNEYRTTERHLGKAVNKKVGDDGSFMWQREDMGDIWVTELTDKNFKTHVTPAAIGAARIETESYTGTGVSGRSNKNSIPITGTPKLIIITGFYINKSNPSESASYNGIWNFGAINMNVYAINSDSNTPIAYTCSNDIEDNQFTWYTTSDAIGQLNRSDVIYDYTIFY